MACWMMERLAFLFLLEEPHSERSCEMGFFFFFFFEPERKVIEMSEKEPGSLETLRSFKCHGSSSNLPLHFYRQSAGEESSASDFWASAAVQVSEVLRLSNLNAP